MVKTRSVRPLTIGLVSGGLGAYWPQFPELLPALEESARFVNQRLAGMDTDLVDVGFVSDAAEAQNAADRLRAADVDLLVVFATTYLTSSMVLPIVQRAAAPVLVVDLQPTARMDHATVDTGRWLAYCGQCSVPELGSVMRRAGIAFRSVSGHLRSEDAWRRIEVWSTLPESPPVFAGTHRTDGSPLPRDARCVHRPHFGLNPARFSHRSPRVR